MASKKLPSAIIKISRYIARSSWRPSRKRRNCSEVCPEEEDYTCNSQPSRQKMQFREKKARSLLISPTEWAKLDSGSPSVRPSSTFRHFILSVSVSPPSLICVLCIECSLGAANGNYASARVKVKEQSKFSVLMVWEAPQGMHNLNLGQYYCNQLF